MAKVHLWSSLRRFTDGQEVVEVEAATVGQMLEALEKGDVAAAQSHMAHHLHLCEDRVRPDADDQFDLRAVLGKGL